jgi:hypothetical protein
MLIRGFNVDTDFAGGTNMHIRIHEGTELTVSELNEIRAVVEPIIGTKVSSLQKTGDGGGDVMIKTKEISSEVREAVFAALSEKYGLTDEALQSVTNVGASMSVPSGNTDVVKISKVLEDIAYESYLHVMPAYTEIVLEGQSVRDEESIVSLNIIRNSYYSDLGFMLGNYNIAILTQMRQVVTNNLDCASMLQKVMRVYNSALKKVQSPE